MNKRRKKLKKSQIAAIIIAAVGVLIAAAVLITNAFIPVKYLTAYLVKKDVNEEGVMRVSFIDVDFGDCILVELPDGKNMLIDGGDGAYPNTLAALKFLNSRGVKKIDYLVCTSVRDEHCGGLAEIVKYKEVGTAFVPHSNNTRITDGYRAFTVALEERGVTCREASVGEGVVEDGFGYFFTFLSPSSYDNPDSAYADMNKEPSEKNISNASAVLWLEYAGVSFAFTSCIGADGLKDLVKNYEASSELGQPFCEMDGRAVKLEDCTVVSVAGHGGKNNTYAPWYDLLMPDYAVISVGKSYADYPSDFAMSDVCAYCEPYLTKYDGDITFTVNATGGCSVKREKD